jgi:hypothetical protein
MMKDEVYSRRDSRIYGKMVIHATVLYEGVGFQ